MSTPQSSDPREILDQLGAIWSDDLGAYASGQLDASQITRGLAMAGTGRPAATCTTSPEANR